MSEAMLVSRVLLFLRSFGFIPKCEVPSMGGKIDLVALNMRGDLFAIEAKISAVQRVLEQCEGHYLCADFICIAWGSKNVSPDLFTVCSERGYGIIHYPPSGLCEWVIKPKRNHKIWKPQRRVLLNNFMHA